MFLQKKRVFKKTLIFEITLLDLWRKNYQFKKKKEKSREVRKKKKVEILCCRKKK
jgi:hypothetical protein